ncbi:MAG: DinB family protein [Paludibacter sp.]|nr:DinB family protein [Paludibacter sp.]
MINVSKGWNEKQKKLNILLPNQKTFEKGIFLLLEMHSLLHDKKVYKINTKTFYDNLWENMKDDTCRIISNKETSILWNIWHITRIEDIISNIIIENKETIFNKEIQTKLNIKIKDTGNAMTYSEIESFNKNINIKELKEYRIKVGKSTQKIIKTIEFSDIKRKAEKEQLEKIKQNGGVIDNPESIWLLDFWGKKNILGLIMMPITRHQIVHLNDCFKIKQKYKK